MSPNSLEGWILLIFGLAFFAWTCNTVRNDQNNDHARRIMEAREFGFRDDDEPSNARHRRFTRRQQ